jgi:hypothetical protein
MGGAKRYPSLFRTLMGFAEGSIHPTGTQILPDGQITSCFPKWRVQPLLQKYFCFRLTQISCISLDVPSRQEGRIARRHERGAGCGGRESVRRAWQSQGEMNLVSGQLACKMIGALADGEAVWFWHPLLVLNSRRLVGPTGRRQNLNPRMTVARRIRRRGERGISRKTIARGMPVDPSEPVVTTLVCFV